MASKEKICVEVCWASPERQIVKSMMLPESATVRDAVVASGLLDEFPELDLEASDVGVFSERRKLTDAIRDGDRIEIYRPLIADPKEVRRQRAGQHKQRRR
jgi:putative ubiquitin-RnfH superfamily antitoxin RatB of RatAB toxin-antitoxin module